MRTKRERKGPEILVCSGERGPVPTSLSYAQGVSKYQPGVWKSQGGESVTPSLDQAG